MGNQNKQDSKKENENEQKPQISDDIYRRNSLFHYKIEDSNELYEKIKKVPERKLIKFLHEHIINSKLKVSEDILRINDQNVFDIKTIECYSLAFIFYRMHMYHKCHENKTVKNLEFEFCQFIQSTIANEEVRKDEKKFKIAVAFLLNYSRGLIDPDAEYLDNFARDSLLMEKTLLDKKETPFKFELFEVENEIDAGIKLGINKFFSSLSSETVKSSLKAFLSSIGILEGKNPEDLIVILKNIEILILKKQIGINGMVGFDFIVISAENLRKDCGYINKKQDLKGIVATRTFLLIWHEVGHYLLRKLTGNVLSVTPRGKGDEPWTKYEAGDRME